MPPRAEAEVRKELSSDERLLWSGCPRRAFDGRALQKVVLCLAFTGVGLFMMVHQNRGFSLFYLTWTGICGFGLLHSLVIAPWDRARQVYGLTNRRVLIVHRGFERRIEDLPLHTMLDTNVQLKERRDRSGTIGFADFAQRCGYDDNDWCMPEFFLVPDAASVAALVRKAIGAAPAARRIVPMPRWPTE